MRGRSTRSSGWPVARVGRASAGRAGVVGLLLITVLGVDAVWAQGLSRFECLDPDQRRVSRIVGGTTAPDGTAPWQVSLQIRRNGQWFHSCGGSLIHPSWVLTAAHCVDDRTTADVSIVHGTQSLASGGVRRPAARLVMHENYDPGSLVNDIALIRLSEPFPASRSQLVQLQSERLERVFGSPGACSVVTGWGETEPRGRNRSRNDAQRAPVPEQLRAVDLPIIDNGTCAEAYPGEIWPSMVCAGYAQGTMDSCKGDSGGPLVVPGGPTGWTQIGVVSWGEGCAQPNSYGVYTRVSHYIDWILERTSR